MGTRFASSNRDTFPELLILLILTAVLSCCVLLCLRDVPRTVYSLLQQLCDAVTTKEPQLMASPHSSLAPQDRTQQRRAVKALPTRNNTAQAQGKGRRRGSELTHGTTALTHTNHLLAYPSTQLFQ